MTAFITICEDGTLGHAGLTRDNALAFAGHLSGIAADLIRQAQTLPAAAGSAQPSTPAAAVPAMPQPLVNGEHQPEPETAQREG